MIKYIQDNEGRIKLCEVDESDGTITPVPFETADISFPEPPPPPLPEGLE